MRVELFSTIPKQAIDIRQKVFIEEQGFQNEFDDIDSVATHIILFDDLENPIATCRFFEYTEDKVYVLGRLAVVKENREKGFGRKIVEEAEKRVKAMGGEELRLHAQCRIEDFYMKLGYFSFGDVEDDEGCPHIWMRKMFT